MKYRINKKFIYDIVLNIIAVSLPVAILQLVIYPYTAKQIDSESYGLMLTIYSAWIIVSNSMGNVINNIRLLKNHEYVNNCIEGDFNIIFRRWAGCAAFIMWLVTWYYIGSFSVIHIALCSLISILIFAKAYLEVGFRLNLNYKLITINSILLSLGFCFGFILTRIIGIWEMIFLCGYMFSVIFCILKTNLLKEKAVKTPLFSRTLKESYHLVGATIIGNLVNYADKMVLFPLMGGTAVSIYYTATIIGKITGMLTGPINSVVLSYITRWDSSKRTVMKPILIIGFTIVSIGYIITMTCGKYVISVLFPQWVDEVIRYMPVTTIAVMLGVLTSIISPFILKYCSIKWQIVISGISSIIYFGSALLLWRMYELMGFCVGTVIGMASKLIIMLYIYYKKPNVLNIDREAF